MIELKKKIPAITVPEDKIFLWETESAEHIETYLFDIQ